MQNLIKEKYAIIDPHLEQSYYRATDISTSETVLVKKIKLKTKDDFSDTSTKLYYENNLKNQRDAQFKINHINVVKLIDYDENEIYQFWVFEYCNSGNLEEYLEQKQNLSISYIIFIILEICQGLQAIHNLNFIHYNLSLKNIMIHKQNKLIIHKIKGFNHCHILESSMAKTYFKSEWQEGLAPEILDPQYLEQGREIKKSDQSADMFSLGCLFYKLIYGCSPFVIDKQVGISGYPQQVQKGTDFKKNNIQIPEKIQQMIEDLLQFNPQSRINLQDLIQQLKNCVNEQFSLQKLPSTISIISNINDLQPPNFNTSQLRQDVSLPKDQQREIIKQCYERCQHIRFLLNTYDEMEYMKLDSSLIPQMICLKALQAGKYMKERLQEIQKLLPNVELDYLLINQNLKQILQIIEERILQLEQQQKLNLPRNLYENTNFDAILKQQIIDFIKEQNVFYKVHYLIIICGAGNNFKNKVIEVTDESLQVLSDRKNSKEIWKKEEIEQALKLLEQN